MSENEIIPSIERILNAVNSDLNNFSNNENAQENTNNETDDIDCVFDAAKWYLQNYPNTEAVKKEKSDKIDEPPIYVADDKKTSKKSGINKAAIWLFIVLIAIMGLCLYFIYESSNYTDESSAYSEPYHDTATYEENSYYDMELTAGSSDTRYIDLDEIIIYSFIPTVSGEYTFSSTSTNTDPDCEVYNASEENIAEDHEYGDVNIKNNFIAGETYYFQIYVYENGANVTVNLD